MRLKLNENKNYMDKIEMGGNELTRDIILT